jgi:thiamine-monophosphate kinase
LDEFGLIRRYFAGATPITPDVILGVGDDCALLQVPAGQYLAVSMDTLVESVHFPKNAPAKDIATRALCTALSDLAAMGAKPLWVTLGLTLPSADETWISAFCEGLTQVCEEHAVVLVGGDMTRGPLTISVQVHGSVEPGKALCRQGARPDDVIYVTGQLGDGAAALAVLQQRLTVSPSCYDYLYKRFYRPQPLWRQAQMLVGIASSAIDVSDGLLADLQHLLNASGTGALVDLGRVPVSPLWRDYVDSGQRERWALCGGDDYQLCFTVPRDKVPTLEHWVQESRLQAKAIGKITHKPGLITIKNGVQVQIPQRGYNHFDPA